MQIFSSDNLFMYAQEYPPYAFRIWKEQLGIKDFSNPLECCGSLVEMPDHTIVLNTSLRQEKKGFPPLHIAQKKTFPMLPLVTSGEFVIRQQVEKIIHYAEDKILQHFMGYPPVFHSIETTEVAPRIKLVSHFLQHLREYPADVSLWLAGVPQVDESSISLAKQVAAHLYFKEIC